MFCGIVEGTGEIVALTKKKEGARIRFQSSFSVKDTKIGDSIAINGCCLTVVTKKGNVIEADLSHETLRVTNLGFLQKGSLINLERPIKLSDRIGGHMVQGHVDGIGSVKNVKKVGDNYEITIRFPKKLRRYLIPKGSVAIDGISMTVNALTADTLTLFVIPHTLQATNLKARRAGDRVNIEVDMVGKYIESLARYGKR